MAAVDVAGVDVTEEDVAGAVGAAEARFPLDAWDQKLCRLRSHAARDFAMTAIVGRAIEPIERTKVFRSRWLPPCGRRYPFHWAKPGGSVRFSAIH